MEEPGILRLPIKFHASQAKVFNHKARFKVLACGRRWGKTRGAINWLTIKVLLKPDLLGWWVSPTYRQAKIAYRYFRRLFYQSGIVVRENKTELSFDLVTGSRLEFRSAEIPDNLRGDGVDYLVVDECSSVAEEAWTEVLRPTLIDSKGQAVFIGTPKGQNWFYIMWQKGQGIDPDYKSWRFSTYDNPILDHKEIKSAEKDLPELVARQEIWAEFVETGGQVFRNVDQCATGVPEEPQRGKVYQAGVDLAKYQDFTVISIRLGNRQVYQERFNRIDWAVQRPRIQAASNLYNNAMVVIDSTGIGDPVHEALAYDKVPIEPYQLTNISKNQLLNNLILKFDNKEIVILNDQVLKTELKAYTYELTSAGRLKMNAPKGKHDDTVIALALAFWGEVRPPAQKTIVNLGNGRYTVR